MPPPFSHRANLGDVIADGDDIYGDGINIAARPEALAASRGLVMQRIETAETEHRPGRFDAIQPPTNLGIF